MPIDDYSSSIESKHHLRMPVAGAGSDLELFIFSGIAVFDELRGTGQSWEDGTAYIDAKYQNVIPQGFGIKPRHCTVDINLASIFNKNEANNTGWAVDEYVLFRDTDARDGEKLALADGCLRLRAKIGIRDSDAYIYRLSYHVTILGEVRDYMPLIGSRRIC